ncbi:MAG: hypothetical protein AUH31_10075 [Armatimonadetes bacterium 13_1_40CM_64_14]|nr:MAG: hypothetical protein AUH31_10075 [Armatimonadetes bacterium 13_1_40CM_64_14]
MPSPRAEAGIRTPVHLEPEAEVKTWSAQAPPIPKYYQLRAKLERQITVGQLAPGTFLPPERVLLQQYGVSRTTLREALRPLLHEGALLSVRGKGIMVAQPAIRQTGDVLMSFSDVLRSQGLQPGMGEVGVTVGLCSHEVGTALRLPPDTQVIRVERVRTGNGQPVNFSISYLPAVDFPGFTAELLAAAGSLYGLLQTRYELHIARAQDEMFARRASKREAGLLGVRPGDPVLVMNRVCVLSSGRPIEYALSVMRSDIYRYVVRLTPPRPASP